MMTTLSLCTLVAALFFTCLSAAPVQLEKRQAGVENDPDTRYNLTVGIQTGLKIAVSSVVHSIVICDYCSSIMHAWII